MNNLAEQAGQLLIIGFEGDRFNAGLEELLQEVRPGGVIFFSRNIAGALEFSELVRQIRDRLGKTCFLAIDQEGGTVDRLRAVLPPLPSARDAARAGLGAALGRIAGRELASFSLNVDFAPVLDLATPDCAEVMGSRVAGSSPEEVVRFAEDFLSGLAESGVIGCGKHFPGLGGGKRDSHREMPRIEKSAADLWREDLAPYVALAAKLPMVMVAHACYPALEGAGEPANKDNRRPLPASLSEKIVSGLLKQRIGFPGLVLSDDLEMGGALEGRNLGEAAVGSMRAGCDMLLVCRHAENVLETHAALCQAAEGDAPFRARIEERSQKVFLFKKRLGVGQGAPAFSAPGWETLRQEIAQFAAEVERKNS